LRKPSHKVPQSFVDNEYASLAPAFSANSERPTLGIEILRP
jgi:hypothetical protein